MLKNAAVLTLNARKREMTITAMEIGTRLCMSLVNEGQMDSGRWGVPYT